MSLSPRSAAFLILLLAFLALLALLNTDPIAQDPAYHQFADQRQFLSIPHALDVLSNLPFLFAGLWGLSLVMQLKQEPSRLVEPWELVGITILFVGIGLVSLGSGYYHWSPDNETLVWDRLPMTVGFTSLFALQIGERISMRAGKWLLIPLLVWGCWSVLYWHWSEQSGQGDLRYYAMVQFLPLLSILLLLWLRPPTYNRASDLVIALAFYALAKVFETLDTAIFGLGEIVSGHTLKHLAAGVAVWMIVRMIKKRVRVLAS